MIIEYAGVAERWAGPGVVHEVRAWWNASQDTEGAVKRAAISALRTQGQVTGHAEIVRMDTSAYSHPQLNAMVRIRVLTPAQLATRTELRTRRYTRCEGCGDNPPGQLVRMNDDNAEQALCYTCWHPIRHTCKVQHWIDRNGRLQV